MREQFEQKYKEIHPEDGSTAKSNGNYSGWVKQAHWWAWQARQVEIDQLKAQLNNMEQCYIEIKKERDDLLVANTAMDRERNGYRGKVEVYQHRHDQSIRMIESCFKCGDGSPTTTLKAVQNSLIGYGKP